MLQLNVARDYQVICTGIPGSSRRSDLHLPGLFTAAAGTLRRSEADVGRVGAAMSHRKFEREHVLLTMRRERSCQLGLQLEDV